MNMSSTKHEGAWLYYIFNFSLVIEFRLEAKAPEW